MKLWTFSVLLLAFTARCAASEVVITTTTLPNGVVGTAYSATVDASGGFTPYKAIASGTLPTLISANASSTTTALNLTGTPTSSATNSFTLNVTGCGGHVSEVWYKVIIQGTTNHVVDLS